MRERHEWTVVKQPKVLAHSLHHFFASFQASAQDSASRMQYVYVVISLPLVAADAEC